MFEELWSKIQIRNRVMEIAETIAPLFTTHFKDQDGNFARYISVKNVEFDIEMVGEMIEIDIDVEFLSDIGTHLVPVIVREFTSQNAYLREQDQYKQLEDRCRVILNIQPFEILYTDDEHFRVVYLASTGLPIHQLELDEEFLDFQLGTLCAYLQGGDSYNMEAQSLKSMLNYLLSRLPFDEPSVNLIKFLLEEHFKILNAATPGYAGVTVFDPSTFRFTALQENVPINKQQISNNLAFLIEILPIQPQELIADRMTDIALFYGEIAYAEYEVSKSVDDTLKRLLNFLEGYELALDRVTMVTLEQLYPAGFTLDLQMLTVFWLLAQYSFDHPDDSSINPEILFSYTDFLLSKRPFQMYSQQFSNPLP